MTDQDNLRIREQLVNSAVTFLKNPKVSSSPFKTKEEFLKKKGLTPDEIKEACKLSSTPLVDTGQTRPAIPDEYNGVSVVESHVYPYHKQQPFLSSLFSRLTEFAKATIYFGAAAYSVLWLYKRFIEPFLFGSTKKKDPTSDPIKKLEESIENTRKEMRDSITNMEANIKQLIQNRSVDTVIPVMAEELKQDLASLKGLLLSRKQFPSAPSAIPMWQLETSKETHQDKSTVHENGSHSIAQNVDDVSS